MYPTALPTTASPYDQLLDTAVTAIYGAQVAHAHLIQHLAAAYGVNAIDLRAVKFLGTIGPDRTPKELGSYLEMGTGAVTALLDRLTKRGLLERVRNPDDRRSVRIALTRDGSAVVESIRAAYRKSLQQGVPAERIDEFTHFTNRLADAFQDASRD